MYLAPSSEDVDNDTGARESVSSASSATSPPPSGIVAKCDVSRDTLSSIYNHN